jgi:multimeric flavodoxin WrbA
MKILILNGSTRKESYTLKMLKAIEEGISKNHEIEWINVNCLTVKPCIGCLKCRPDRECIQKKDDGHYAAKKIKESDALIIGSPTYYGNITGPLKTLIDRVLPSIEYQPANELVFPKGIHKGQKAVIVTAANSPWPLTLLSTNGGGAIRAMKTILKNGRYRLIGSINLGGVIMKKNLPERIARKARKLGGKF